MERKRKGSIRQTRLHGRDVWLAKVTVDYETRSKVADTEEEARSWLAGIIAEHPTWEWNHPNAGKGKSNQSTEGRAMATRTRKGGIYEVPRKRGSYYSAHVCIGYKILHKCSYDRAECEAWLAEMIAANPVAVWDTSHPRKPVERPNPFRAARLAVTETPSLWMVVAETNPMTAHYRIRVRKDWQIPERVLGYDLLSEAPFSWIADDNGGEGYGSAEEARTAALAIERDPCVSLAVKPLARRWRNGGNEHNGKN